MRKHPLLMFFVLAFVVTWWIYPLLRFSPLLGFFGLFGPALAALITTAVTGGRAGVVELLRRIVRYRVHLSWYAVALGLPVVLALATAVLGRLLGVADVVRLGRISVLDFAVFVLVVGEEIGWRGYALPTMLRSRSAVGASVLLGGLWGLWHLPGFLVSGTPQYGLPFVPFVLLTVEYSVLLAWLHIHSGGSVLLATLCHGAINLSQGVVLGGIQGADRYWLLTIPYGVAALGIAVALQAAPSSRFASRVSGSPAVGKP
jgi:uncharacterized protein